MGERTGGFRRFKHRVLPGRVMDLASNALLTKGVQSFLSPTRIAQALDRGGSTLRSKELPVCVEGPNSHCRSLERQRALWVPFINFRSTDACLIKPPRSRAHRAFTKHNQIQNQELARDRPGEREPPYGAVFARAAALPAAPALARWRRPQERVKKAETKIVPSASRALGYA
jgi:hypothetical protein